MARIAPQKRRGIYAYGLLLRNISSGDCELHHRLPLRLARGIRGGRSAGFAGGIHPIRSQRTEAVARADRTTRPEVDGPAGILRAILPGVPAAYGVERHVS